MKTVFVGLSGGVDSAVSAYLLKKAGHRVVGAFIKVWEPDFLPCTSGQDRLDAMRVAAHLGIPFVSYDLEEEYKRGVVDYFIEEYKAGRTPNPDVMCNREIKFGAFWHKAKEGGADMIATGHYARRSEIKNLKSKTDYQLLRGVDTAKDQSYFLWTLTQDDLSHILFPIGHLEKSEVRRIANQAGLPNAVKKDSQGLCFLGHVDMKEFLQHYIPVERGVVRDVRGNEIGEHDGVPFYTLGQHLPLTGGKRLYVVSKDHTKNELIASERPQLSEAISLFSLQHLNWIREEPQTEKTYEAEIRYHGERHPVRVEGNTAVFEKPILAAVGQSLVVYDGASGECMGGGIIESNVDNR